MCMKQMGERKGWGCVERGRKRAIEETERGEGVRRGRGKFNERQKEGERDR